MNDISQRVGTKLRRRGFLLGGLGSALVVTPIFSGRSLFKLGTAEEGASMALAPVAEAAPEFELLASLLYQLFLKPVEMPEFWDFNLRPAAPAVAQAFKKLAGEVFERIGNMHTFDSLASETALKLNSFCWNEFAEFIGDDNNVAQLNRLYVCGENLTDDAFGEIINDLRALPVRYGFFADASKATDILPGIRQEIMALTSGVKIEDGMLDALSKEDGSLAFIQNIAENGSRLMPARIANQIRSIIIDIERNGRQTIPVEAYNRPLAQDWTVVARNLPFRWGYKIPDGYHDGITPIILSNDHAQASQYPELWRTPSLKASQTLVDKSFPIHLIMPSPL
jgi:hypothetical protein